jgi:hypothetical protein
LVGLGLVGWFEVVWWLLELMMRLDCLVVVVDDGGRDVVDGEVRKLFIYLRSLVDGLGRRHMALRDMPSLCLPSVASTLRTLASSRQ